MYSTDQDIFDRLGESKVRQLTDDGSTGAVDVSLVGRLRSDAAEVINTHLRGRYDLPLASPPAVLAQIEADLLAHRLYRRRANVDIPDSVIEAKTDAMRLLRDFASGAVPLGIDEDGDGEDDGAASYRVRTSDPVLTDHMDRYFK